MAETKETINEQLKHKSCPQTTHWIIEMLKSYIQCIIKYGK